MKMKQAYITAAGIFLPGPPVANDEMEEYLGKVHGKRSVARERILQQNGIKTRYYALDRQQNSQYSNAAMAARAIERALGRSTLTGRDVELLCAGTTQADLPVPGFASMVHGELDFSSCELASFQSVCASSMMALQHAAARIRCGDVRNAVCVGSEFASRMFKASRFEAQQLPALPFATEFLRWMLSDGAGALVLQDQPAPSGLSLAIEWLEVRSHAHEFPVCMYAGKNSNKDPNEPSWLDYPDFESAAQAGAINLKQDIRLLDQVVKTGVAHYFELIDRGKINVGAVDWLCCHYSSEYFKEPTRALMQKGGAEIAPEKWFSNLSSKGNTGSASLFIMLEELLYSGRLTPGQRILCMVPESGRFVTAFMQLRVEGADRGPAPREVAPPPIVAPELNLEKTDTSEWLVRQLTQVWVEFETRLYKVPIVQKIHDGQLSRADYVLLLKDLRQQVIDGSQWIARAASNIDIELFELRSAFIRHTAAEHRDYQLLERNFESLGEDPETIRRGEKNVGSLALSAFMFQQASQPNPIDLLGAMFIIEGIGKRLAAEWGALMQQQLQLTDDQVSFFTYHGVADENHFRNLEQALNHPKMNLEIARRIVKTAKTTARLYRMQLEELGNY
jgi:3-oxoacyl-[acyl-carrier-protein] synthase III